MRPWQLLTLATLSAAPLVIFAGFGAWSLYESGRWFWLWWILPVCWGVSWLLLRWWGKNAIVLPLPELDRTHWTPQDQSAVAIITAEQERVREIPATQLTNPEFYVRTTEALALKIAKHYHPHAADPLGSLSVVEILTAVQLISDDVEEWFLRYVPASHLVTVSQWRMLSQAPEWWRTASNVGWVASIALNPLNLGRYIASKLAVEPLTQQLQQNLLGAFYGLYIRQAGYYLIELNSGRLQGGSKRYRAWLQLVQGTGGEAATVTAPVTVTIAVIGQVKAGKSSLINALLRDHQATTDLLPATSSVRRYRAEFPDRHEQLILLDTPGYSDAGSTAAQLRETQMAVHDADLVLLVIDARSPARDADVRTLDALRQWWASEVHRKPPAMLTVVNKVDGLSPILEWSPPYNVEQPVRPKEHNIAAAVEYAREVFGATAVGFVPTCTDRDNQRVWNIAEGLVPLMSQHLDAARSTALLRTLHAEIQRNKVHQVVDQVLEVGRHMKSVVDAFRKP